MYEKLFHIHTRKERNDKPNKVISYHPYEPTPYEALEILFEEYDVKESDHIVDFGCGKGRLNFFIHYFYRASVTGIEMNEDFYQDAQKNRESYGKKTKQNVDCIQFFCCLAEEYQIKSTDNRFYFFNPFSIDVFRKVIDNIIISVQNNPRSVEVILYYAHEDYIYFLEDETLFELVKEVQLPHLYKRNPYERFLIYRL